MVRRTRKASTKRRTKSPGRASFKKTRKVKLTKKQAAIFDHLMRGGTLDESE